MNDLFDSELIVLDRDLIGLILASFVELVKFGVAELVLSVLGRVGSSVRTDLARTESPLKGYPRDAKPLYCYPRRNDVVRFAFVSDADRIRLIRFERCIRSEIGDFCPRFLKSLQRMSLCSIPVDLVGTSAKSEHGGKLIGKDLGVDAQNFVVTIIPLVVDQFPTEPELHSRYQFGGAPNEVH